MNFFLRVFLQHLRLRRWLDWTYFFFFLNHSLRSVFTLMFRLTQLLLSTQRLWDCSVRYLDIHPENDRKWSRRCIFMWFLFYTIRNAVVLPNQLTHQSTEHFSSSILECQGGLWQSSNVQQCFIWKAVAFFMVSCHRHHACVMFSV